MPLLFLLSGISTKYALQKRTTKQYLLERIKRLLVPLIFGTIVFMPIMTFVADKFNCSYGGTFWEHYAIFFSKFTDLIGADGGFSLGQFWFLMYLMIISIVGVGIITFSRSIKLRLPQTIPFWAVLLLGFLLPILSELLSIGGKSLAEYTFFFLLGVFVFSDDKIVNEASRNWLVLLIVGLTATAINVYLFVWTRTEHMLINTITKYVSEWFMVLALLGLSKRLFNVTSRITDYLSKRSFLVYIYHFIWVVVIEYMLSGLRALLSFLLLL